MSKPSITCGTQVGHGTITGNTTGVPLIVDVTYPLVVAVYPVYGATVMPEGTLVIVDVGDSVRRSIGNSSSVEPSVVMLLRPVIDLLPDGKV